MSYYIAATVGAAVVYGMYEQNENAKDALKESKNQAAQMNATQLKNEKELKDRTANEKALENAKQTRARNQQLSMGGATKNNTIKTTALGVPSTPSGGGKTLLGL